ncbi:zinc finger 721-like, partial [Pelobates cultripes]
GSRASKLVAQRLRERQQQTQIAHIIKKKGQKVHLPSDICREFAQYYSQLYNLTEDPNTPQPTEVGIRSYLNNIPLPTLSESQKQLLAAPITENEISECINSLPKGKAPGPDRFTNEYYTKFPTPFSPTS